MPQINSKKHPCFRPDVIVHMNKPRLTPTVNTPQQQQTKLITGTKKNSKMNVRMCN